MDLSVMFYVILVIGFLLVLIPPINSKIHNQLLNADDYKIQVYIPTTIGFLLLILGFYGVLKDTYNERHWQILIAISAIGSIYLSSIAGFQSLILLRWQSD